MVGSIDIGKEFDAVLLVLLDHCLEAFEIYEADRPVVVAALVAPGSRARNERHAMAVRHHNYFANGKNQTDDQG